MSSYTSPLPDDIDALKVLVQHQAVVLAEREAQLEQQRTAIERRDAKIASLEEHLKVLLARRFGASSERVPDGQLGLFNEAEAVEQPVPARLTVGAHERRHGRGRRLPEALPRVDVIHEVPETERVCPHDGTPLVPFIGEETSEQLDIVPAQVRVLRHVRRKYACPMLGAKTSW